MDNNQVELTALLKTVEGIEQEVRILDDLQLALIGGGVGEATLG